MTPTYYPAYPSIAWSFRPYSYAISQLSQPYRRAVQSQIVSINWFRDGQL